MPPFLFDYFLKSYYNLIMNDKEKEINEYAEILSGLPDEICESIFRFIDYNVDKLQHPERYEDR